MVNEDITKDFEIIPYTTKYLQDFKRLFYRSLKREMPESYFLHNTQNTPYGKPIQFLMKHRNAIIGNHSIRPLMFKINNRMVLGGQTYDTMTDPDFRNMGVFTTLSKKAHEEARKQNYQFVCGYANPNSINTYQKNLKHKLLDDINFIKIINFEIMPVDGFLVYKNEIPDGISHKILQNNKQFLCVMYKDLAFLNWRYQKQFENYKMYFKKDEFLIITKEYNNQIQVLDYFVENPNSFKMALTAIRETQNKSKDLTMWIPKKHSLIKETNLEYEELNPPQLFHVISFDKKIKRFVLDSNSWNYTMSDSDVF